MKDACKPYKKVLTDLYWHLVNSQQDGLNPEAMISWIKEIMTEEELDEDYDT